MAQKRLRQSLFLFHRIIISMLSFKVVDTRKKSQKANHFIIFLSKPEVSDKWKQSRRIPTLIEINIYRLTDLQTIFKAADVFLPV